MGRHLFSRTCGGNGGALMAEQDLDRNEAATPYKLQKARDKGQVGKSTEVVSAVVFTTAAAYLYWQGWDGLAAQFRFDHQLLSQAARLDPSAANLWRIVSKVISEGMSMLAPFLGALMLAAIVSTLVQTGPIASAEPVKPDFDRLNPVNGFKKVFSARTLFDGARAIVKLLLLSVVIYHALKALVPQFFHLSALPAATLAHTVMDDVAATALKLALMLCLIAAADYAFTRREFSQKMRMSRREMKDENRHREGDPRIRARLRELRREALKRSMAVRHTAQADVLLTNPTHVAVALRYVHGQMHSPQMVAKGAGTLAASMRTIAARHNIPIVQNPPLARELYRSLEVDQHVPAQLYSQVARILVWVFAMRDARMANGRNALAEVAP
ncbi:EscU/YscU/HrcU family type III secretion system export apparatus switch protein [Caenimonas koreensis]|nr:EscU/YscU/HrcU family type III secretion system export apparatus switch protein [Caenimonas koreensis]